MEINHDLNRTVRLYQTEKMMIGKIYGFGSMGGGGRVVILVPGRIENMNFGVKKLMVLSNFTKYLRLINYKFVFKFFKLK